MSPNEQKITSGRAAISSALSMISSGVTQTGQPGPWISSMPSGSSWSMPCRMIEWVWPPQTSIIAQGCVDRRVDVVEQPLGQRRVLELVEVLHAASFRSSGRSGRVGGSPACSAARPQWSPNSASSSPICRKSSRVSLRRLLVEPLQGEADVDDRVVADLRCRGRTPGTPPWSRRRSRPGPSACRPAPQISSTCAGNR